MISSYICDDFYIFWFLYISIDSSFFQNSFPIWKTLFKRNLKCKKSPSSIHISRNQIQLFCCLSCLFFCVRGCALSISLTLMNKKIHETRFPRKPRLPKSSLLVFAYTNATTTSIHTDTNIAATHRIHPKTIDCFHDLHSFSFSYQLSRYIITLCNICQPFFWLFLHVFLDKRRLHLYNKIPNWWVKNAFPAWLKRFLLIFR